MSRHARERHGTVLHTCESCNLYQSERKSDVRRHAEGCRRRKARSVTTETVGEWDISPGGTRKDVLGKGDARKRKSEGETETKREREGQQKAVAEEHSDDVQGKKRRVALDEGRHKKKPAVEAMGIARDPPPVQRWPTLKYLTDIGSPIGNHPTTPQKPEEEETGSGDESPEQEEESAAHAKEPQTRQAEKMSYEIELRPGVVFRKIVRTIQYPDGRLVVEEENTVERACSCKEK